MILISNYGNVNGPNANQNTPEYVENAIRMGYYCRIDVTYTDQLYMNNSPITLEFLLKYHKKLWICCMNIETLKYLLEFECFHIWYKDEILTNYGLIWNSSIQTKKAIYVVNTVDSIKNINITCGHAICSDYISKVDFLDNRR
jgi:hypothetical protein